MSRSLVPLQMSQVQESVMETKINKIKMINKHELIQANNSEHGYNHFTKRSFNRHTFIPIIWTRSTTVLEASERNSAQGLLSYCEKTNTTKTNIIRDMLNNLSR